MYGFIGQYEEIDDAAFVMDLRQLEATNSNINIRINCGGGDVYKGMTIFNAIKNSRANIEGYIDGMAASMGAVISAACKKIHMSKYGRYMTHRVTGFSGGNSDDMRTFADELDALEKTIASILAKRTGLSEEDAKKKYITNQDRWVGADQALTEKLVDSVYDADPVTVPEGNDVLNAFNAYQQQFQNKIAQNQNSDMKQFALALGLAETATEAEIVAAINKLKTEKDTAVNKAQEVAKANAKTLVSNAIAKGQLVEADRAVFEPMAENNYDAAVAAIAKIPEAKKPSKVIGNTTKKVDGAEETEDDEPATWEDLVKKGDKYVADFKVNNAEKYNQLLNTYRSAPVATGK